MIRRFSAIALGAVLLAGCAPSNPQVRSFKRVLQEAPGNAQPSRIVAREIELMKRAREIGQPAAASEYASFNAIVLAAGGESEAEDFLALSNAGELTEWQPKAVWLSCDGRLAISDGRFETAEGLVGDYMTSWVRNRVSGDYVWLHNAARFDDPQPPTKPVEAQASENEIVVDGLVSVKGHVADCGARPAPLPAATEPFKEIRSPDGTLVWRWRYTPSARILELRAWTGGEWQVVMGRSWPAKASS